MKKIIKKTKKASKSYPEQLHDLMEKNNITHYIVSSHDDNKKGVDVVMAGDPIFIAGLIHYSTLHLNNALNRT